MKGSHSLKCHLFISSADAVDIVEITTNVFKHTDSADEILTGLDMTDSNFQ